MRRGSTPTNTFNLDIDLRQAVIFVSYAQGDNVVVEKTGEDLTVEENKIIVHLSQEDTLAFKTGNVLVQIRCVFPYTGDADASNIICTTAERILKDGVI